MELPVLLLHTNIITTNNNSNNNTNTNTADPQSQNLITHLAALAISHPCDPYCHKWSVKLLFKTSESWNNSSKESLAEFTCECLWFEGGTKY